jgi:energy-coupling factor transport system permease protein
MRIVAGRYIPSNSLLHTLNATAKFLTSFILIVAVILSDDLIDYVLIGIFAILLMLLSRVNILTYLKGIKSIWLLIAFALVIQLIYSGVFSALESMGRIILILILAEVLTFTTRPIDIAHTFEDVMKISGISLRTRQELSMVMMIALRFAPVMLEEIDRIIKAQVSRGAKIDTGKPWERIKSLVSVTVPLMVSAVRKAEEVALAMEVRRFDPSRERSRYKTHPWRKHDLLLLITSAFTITTVILI